MPQRELSQPGVIFFGIPLDIIMSSQVLDMKKAAEIASSGVPTSETRLVQYIAAKSLLKLADTKYILKAEAELKKEISSFKSANQASKTATMIGAYDSKSGKILFRLSLNGHLPALPVYADGQTASARKEWLVADLRQVVFGQAGHFHHGIAVNTVL